MTESYFKLKTHANVKSCHVSMLCWINRPHVDSWLIDHANMLV